MPNLIGLNRKRTSIVFNRRHVQFNEKIVYKDVFKADKEENFEILEENTELSLEENTDSNVENPDGEITENVRHQISKTPENLEESHKIKTSKRKRTNDKIDESECSVRKQPRREAKANYKITPISYVAQPINDISLALLVEVPQNKHIDLDPHNVEDEIRFVLPAHINKDTGSYLEAINSYDKGSWEKAILEKLNLMKDNDVWEIVDRPLVTKDGDNPNIIDSRWVFKVKTDEKGQKLEKARLVIRGFKDNQEYELTETYAPVSNLSLIRSVLAVVNIYNLEMIQMDVKTEFLNGIIDSEIYMEIPDRLGFDKVIKKKKVCRLKKALYGLRISPKKWNVRITLEATK